MPDESPFARSDADKAAQLARVRQRLAAATPPTPRPRRKLAWDWRRSLLAAVLLLILLAVWL